MMNIPDSELEFETHIGFYKAHGNLSGDSKKDAYWYYQAQDTHTLRVIDALGDIQMELVILGQQIGMGDPYYQLVFGAARRSKMIWGAVRQLYGLIAPNRDEPLLQDDVFEAARALNDIYIHTRGVLDNYAWAILHLFGDEDARKLHHTDISLFRKRFRAIEVFSDFIDLTKPFDKWELEIKERRDPVAHRIPLSVPPSLLNEEDQTRYGQVNDKYSEAQSQFFELMRKNVAKEEIDAAKAELDAIHEQLQKIGKFVPMIVHDPNDGGVRIYPTVPEDIGNLVKLSRTLNSKIQERLNS